MLNAIVILFWLSIIAFVTGLVNPKLIPLIGNEKNRKMIALQYGILIVALFFTIGVIASSQTPVNNNKKAEKVNQEKQKSNEEVKQMETKTNIKAIVKDNIGEDHYRKHVDASATNHVTVWLTLKDNLTKNMIKKGAWKNSKDLFADIFEAREDVKSVALLWYPEDSKMKAMSLEIKSDTFDSLNWNDLDYSSMPKIVDEYYQSKQFN